MNPTVSDPQQKKEGEVNFKCSDVGLKHCDWHVSGNSEQEIMPKIELHGREKHGLEIDDYTRNRFCECYQSASRIDVSTD